jgi:hypothetical protein
MALRDWCPHKLLCDQMKEDEANGACGMHRGEEKCIQGFGVET